MLRVLLWALAIAFVVGFLIGSLLRRELERPVRYIGGQDGPTTLWDGAPSRIRLGTGGKPIPRLTAIELARRPSDVLKDVYYRRETAAVERGGKPAWQGRTGPRSWRPLYGRT
jgi:hypothetical protein